MKLHHTIRLRAAVAAAVALLFLCCQSQRAVAQGKEIVLNLAPVDGVPLTPENIFSFGIQSGFSKAVTATIKGAVRYRASGLSFAYTFTTTLKPGMNMLDGGSIHPGWTFSGSALRELFMVYHMLPEGTYEYCVTVAPLNSAGESDGSGESTECLYGKKDDIFLINLVDPENNAKIYEYYPVFSWIVNYPFASQLTYRIRVAEIKEGQNVAGAITRNNPVYQESNLPQTTTTYPVYSTLLKAFQPYAWTVDAYYKGILLGGAEPWKFTIIEDSTLVGIPREVPFIDIRNEKNASGIYAVGKVKIKYVLENLRAESLQVTVTNSSGETITIPITQLNAVYGDNRFEIDLTSTGKFRHLQTYRFTIQNSGKEIFTLPFKYVNPDFLH